MLRSYAYLSVLGQIDPVADSRRYLLPKNKNRVVIVFAIDIIESKVWALTDAKKDGNESLLRIT